VPTAVRGRHPSPKTITMVEDLEEHRITASFAQSLVDVGMSMPQATELAPVLAHMLLKTSRTSSIVGWIAMLLLLEDAKPMPQKGGMDALMAVSSMTAIAKKMIRKDLAHVLDERFVRVVEMALDERWPDLIAQMKTWKKDVP
jgi:hypothetical protein